MIIENYSTFRAVANPGGLAGGDGLTEFNQANMRAGGFNGGFVLSSTSAFPIVISCNVNFADTVAGVDEYDWWVSQQTSVAADKPLTVLRKDTAPDTHSGRIEIDLAAWASTEYPDPFDLSTIPVLFHQIHIYAIERLGGGIQRLDLATHLYNANKPTTDIDE